MRNKKIAAALLCCLSVSARADVFNCSIVPYSEAEIGSQVIGVIERVLVDRGDFVKKGQVLAELNADVERAQVRSAESRAGADGDLRAAESNYEFAQKRKARTAELYRRNFVSQQANDQAATEARVAAMRLKQARETQRAVNKDLGLARAQLEQRTIRSPSDGVVVDRFLSAGERVEDRPLLKIATIDPLRVEAVVPAGHFGRIPQGTRAAVRPDLADARIYAASVSAVDRVIDNRTNTFRVRLDLPNPHYVLPSGLRCKVEFDEGISTPETAKRP